MPSNANTKDLASVSTVDGNRDTSAKEETLVVNNPIIDGKGKIFNISSKFSCFLFVSGGNLSLSETIPEVKTPDKKMTSIVTRNRSRSNKN